MPIRCETADGILFVTVDNPPVNALSQAERQGLLDAFADVGDDVRAVVLSGAGTSFIAGADVREFDAPPAAPHLPQVVAAIEACARPVIAAIAGHALGGGLEIALGCHYRIAAPGAKLGLPEVTMGVVPGAGGTQRLPRLIAADDAGRMITGGKPIAARKALECGLIDRIAADPKHEAIALAREAIVPRRLSQARPLAAPLDAVAAEVRRTARGAEAPPAALALVEAALTLPFEDGIARERETFLRLRAGPQAAALRHVFFAERAAAKPPADVAAAQPRAIAQVGVIGAGTMGTGIAMNVADAGLPVTLVEMSDAALAAGLDRIATSYRDSAARGRIAPDQAEARIAAITGSTDYDALGTCDLIIEAAFESMEVKRAIFGRLTAIAKPAAILATNTSYLDLDIIAEQSGRPADVVGLHYFSPANVMRLLEIVRGRATADDVLVTALAFARRTAKVPVVAGVCNGFIGNRLLRAYNREAGLLLLEGGSPAGIDRALTDFGMAMGPFAVADLSGIDIGYKARQAMAPGSFEPAAFRIHDALVERQELGRKSKRGFYLHDGDRAGQPNPAVEALLREARQTLGCEPRPIAAAEIVDRCLIAVALEGEAILREKIAARPGDIDVVFVDGYGFPRHRGGPMFHVAALGPDHVGACIRRFAQGRFGHWWRT